MASSESPVVSESLDLRVRAELVRTAYVDSLYGAQFGILVALLFGFSVYSAFPPTAVVPWLACTLVCNALRLFTRWRYLRQPVSLEDTAFWRNLFVVVSALTGLSWGLGAWLFYTAHESIYRVMIVLVLAGLTTGASRLLAPILAANVTYLHLSIVPLQLKLMANGEIRSGVLGAMCLLYLGYMTVAARQQVRTLRRTIRLGYENTALVDSLRTAKETAEQFNRHLSAEIARREIVESDLRAASESAVAANRAKSEFLATMSHEIRTPMNGIIGMLRIVQDSTLTPAQREQIETAVSSADTLLDLLNDILDLSKIESGRLELERIVFSPATTLKGVADLLRSRARSKGIDFRLEIDPRLPVALLGDPLRLRQVLFNLTGNAIKFTNRGFVAVRAQCDARDARDATLSFAITDSGIGIDAAGVTRLFQPFTQADSSMSRRFGGTGLGLAISQKLVEAMGGKIAAASEPGQGSVFHFTLRFDLASPALAPELSPAGGREMVFPKLRGRVLVVEDDRINQRVITYFLKQMGLETELAEDGLAAVDAVKNSSWDAVLMDCQLPRLDGLEATRRIRTQLAGQPLPIIALTANAGAQDRADCLAAGMDDFLTKPLQVDRLAATLQKWLKAADSG